MMNRENGSSVMIVVGALLGEAAYAQSLPPPPPGVQVVSAYGYDFSVIGNPGNAAYSGPTSNGYPGGRGGVPYVYGMARTEVSTAQWLQFANVAASQDVNVFLQVWPTFWGGTRDNAYTGPGRHYDLVSPDAGLTPVTGITWRAAAMYCNWLCNGQQNNVASFMSGAYDVSTFGVGQGGFTDQLTHNAGAQFWIPTVDEWLKASHYDPNRNGPGQGGYWRFSNRSDAPLVYGPPGQGDSDGGQGWDWSLRLASYPQTQTPWGLLDASGMAAEWVEDYESQSHQLRLVEGSGYSWAGPTSQGGLLWSLDDIRYANALAPDAALDTGLRIAFAVPSPATGVLLVSTSCAVYIRRKRRW